MDFRFENRDILSPSTWQWAVIAITISVGSVELAVVSGGPYWIAMTALLICGGNLVQRVARWRAVPAASSPEFLATMSTAMRPTVTRLLTALRALPPHRDPLFIDLSVLQLAQLADEAEAIARGVLVFSNTETWRAAYQKLLTDPDIKRYRSVAWVRSDAYWRDFPGRQSMRLNLDLAQRGLSIERIIILGERVWPPTARWPGTAMRRWIEQQHNRGLKISLVREADLAQEANLIDDFGIYGTRATGSQKLDGHSRTVQFQLFFDEVSLRQAEDRWDRLTVFARPYGTLLDP